MCTLVARGERAGYDSLCSKTTTAAAHWERPSTLQLRAQQLSFTFSLFLSRTLEPVRERITRNCSLRRLYPGSFHSGGQRIKSKVYEFNDESCRISELWTVRFSPGVAKLLGILLCLLSWISLYEENEELAEYSSIVRGRNERILFEFGRNDRSESNFSIFFLELNFLNFFSFNVIFW